MRLSFAIVALSAVFAVASPADLVSREPCYELGRRACPIVPCPRGLPQSLAKREAAAFACRSGSELERRAFEEGAAVARQLGCPPQHCDDDGN
ncbi:hypothetical protein AURDEDRAFT_173831 [Auricularia subglabra TFB-10046 SS5]|uniref:Uncharacterized protein n=1 Tax=Auricularia subglabra (strain TFB-10046 / SS5) TaxID=717982 RepID=J0DAA9_AURST|nr:hypothetical protein AURDEDRAFT_173831 [Auricularia subglabra TFB-10046 SS5]